MTGRPPACIAVRIGLAAVAFAMSCTVAHADRCARSRDYILEHSYGDLPHKPQAYRDLFRQCRAALQLPNVKDAFLLKAGAVAVVPSRDSLSATASTLARFCTQFPRGTLRFITHKEMPHIRSLASAVKMPTAHTTSCRTITGR